MGGGWLVKKINTSESSYGSPKHFSSLTVVIFRQGDLNELMGKVPPEVWEAKSVVETEFNKLTASGN